MNICLFFTLQPVASQHIPIKMGANIFMVLQGFSGFGILDLPNGHSR
jgi:hypothetical protein